MSAGPVRAAVQAMRHSCSQCSCVAMQPTGKPTLPLLPTTPWIVPEIPCSPGPLYPTWPYRWTTCGLGEQAH